MLTIKKFGLHRYNMEMSITTGCETEFHINGLVDHDALPSFLLDTAIKIISTTTANASLQLSLYCSWTCLFTYSFLQSLVPPPFRTPELNTTEQTSTLTAAMRTGLLGQDAQTLSSEHRIRQYCTRNINYQQPAVLDFHYGSTIVWRDHSRGSLGHFTAWAIPRVSVV